MIQLSIFNDFCTWWVVWWIIPFVIGIILGYVSNTTWKSRYNSLKQENDGFRNANKRLKEDGLATKDVLQKLKSNFADLEFKNKRLQSQKDYMQDQFKELSTKNLSEKQANQPPKENQEEKKLIKAKDLPTTKPEPQSLILNKSISETKQEDVKNTQDITVNSDIENVKGIGPVIASVLLENGVHDIKQVSRMSQAQIKNILDKYGSKYSMIDYSQWALRAKAILNDRESNVEPNIGANTDLKVFEGIGQRIETILKNNHIQTWSDLASTHKVKLIGILVDSDPVYKSIDPSSWPKQAQLALNQKHQILSEYQEYLRNKT